MDTTNLHKALLHVDASLHYIAEMASFITGDAHHSPVSEEKRIAIILWANNILDAVKGRGNYFSNAEEKGREERLKNVESLLQSIKEKGEMND